MTPQPKGYGPYPYRLHGDSSKNQLKLDDEYQQDAASSGMKDDGKFVVQQIYDMDDDDESDGQSDSGEFPSISLAANIEQHISRPKRTKEATENDTASQPHFCRYVRIRKHTVRPISPPSGQPLTSPVVVKSVFQDYRSSNRKLLFHPCHGKLRSYRIYHE